MVTSIVSADACGAGLQPETRAQVGPGARCRTKPQIGSNHYPEAVRSRAQNDFSAASTSATAALRSRCGEPWRRSKMRRRPYIAGTRRRAPRARRDSAGSTPSRKSISRSTPDAHTMGSRLHSEEMSSDSRSKSGARGVRVAAPLPARSRGARHLVVRASSRSRSTKPRDTVGQPRDDGASLREELPIEELVRVRRDLQLGGCRRVLPSASNRGR